MGLPGTRGGYGGWALFREVQKLQFAPVDQAPGVTRRMSGFILKPYQSG